ncbi:MAG: hypothetical protein ACLFSQ_12710 [Candidatus Zixiibacteriota bacterium]
MGFEFIAFALIALFTLFIIERIYRKVLDNERQIDMQRNKFRVLEDRLRKQAKFIKQHTQNKNSSKNNEQPLNRENVKRCSNCNKYYDAILPNCPYCGK